MSGAVPQLRFPGFAGDWMPVSMGEALERASDPVEVDPTETYREIGVRSHGRGLFHKDPLLGEELGNKRVFRVVPNALVLNIVFAWEQAVAMTSDDELGFIASHRFPMFLANHDKACLPFILRFLLTKRGKELLELASPGGAGRNKTLGQQEFLKLKAMMPEPAEQQKIADFLGAVDAKLDALRRKKSGLEAFKSGLMQRLFSQDLRFTRDDGTDFPDWEKRRLSDLMVEAKERNRDLFFSREDVLSVSGELGCVNQIEHLGRSYAGVSVKDYHIARTGDVVYTKSPLKNNPYGIIKANFGRDGIVSTLYAVYRPTRNADACYLHQYFGSDENLNNYLRPIVRKGAKNDMKVKNSDVLRDFIPVPHPDEQRKIGDALSTLDAKISAVADQITQMESFKKGLLQQMFV